RIGSLFKEIHGRPETILFARLSFIPCVGISVKPQPCKLGQEKSDIQRGAFFAGSFRHRLQQVTDARGAAAFSPITDQSLDVRIRINPKPDTVSGNAVETLNDMIEFVRR